MVIKNANTWKFPAGEVGLKLIEPNPKTDPGKNSHKGLLMVYEDEKGNLKVKDQATEQEEQEGLLETVFLDGRLVRYQSLSEIRDIIENNVAKDL